MQHEFAWLDPWQHLLKQYQDINMPASQFFSLFEQAIAMIPDYQPDSGDDNLQQHQKALFRCWREHWQRCLAQWQKLITDNTQEQTQLWQQWLRWAEVDYQSMIKQDDYQSSVMQCINHWLAEHGTE